MPLMDETVGDRLDRLDARVRSLRWVVRVMARMLGLDWAEISRRAQSDMEADERKREREARLSRRADG